MRLNSLNNEYLEDAIIWNEESNKNSHSKSEHKVDISEVFSAHKAFFRGSETIVN